MKEIIYIDFIKIDDKQSSFLINSGSENSEKGSNFYSAYSTRLIERAGGYFGFKVNCTKDIYKNQFGKPQHDKYFFNISHSNDIIVCASCLFSSIGIDVEKTREIDVDRFKKVFTQEELEQINQSANVYDTFWKYWTLKEAVAKAEGKGMVLPFKEILLKNKGALVINSKFEWITLSTILEKNYYLALAFVSANNIELKISEIKI